MIPSRSIARRLPVITGMGCVSPLGHDAATTRDSLRGGLDGVVPVTLFSVGSFQSKTAGQVPDAFLDLAVSIRPEAKAWPRAAKLILMAVHEALAARPEFRPDVVVVGTTSGGMDFGEQFFRGLKAGMSARGARRCVRGYLPHQPVFRALEHLGWNAPVRVISNACASGTNALAWAAGLVRNGQAGRVLAVGFDALSELVFAGFDALRASTPEKCRPFDSARSGLSLGEGAAAFLIEEAKAVDCPLAAIAGYGFANDNHHLTQPEPEGAGPRLSMRRALDDAGWSSTDVDYINAHGTGTPFNDSSEAAAIRAVCPTVAVSSTKGMIGHALGAAGAIEAACCIHAIHGEFLPPNINMRETDSGLDIVANHARHFAPRRVLSNSFGFGGANATIALEKYER